MERTAYSLRRFGATIVGAAMLAQSGFATAQAPKTHYDDVEPGVWYEDAADALIESGALDRSEARLRPRDLATRAEVMKMLVLVYGKDLMEPGAPSFDDVPETAWYYPYVETSAAAGWVRGDRNCYKEFRPCTARPRDGVNRAEMAALLQRAFELSYTENAPVFPDNRRGAWYFVPVQTAADHCILQGDDGTGMVRPDAFMNRAEMVVMFERASENLRYSRDCGIANSSDPEILNVSIRSAQRLRVFFNVALNRTIADDTFRYQIDRIGGGSVTVSNVTILDDHTVELVLEDAMSVNATYRLTVEDLRTEGGEEFTDRVSFTVTEPSPDMISVSPLSAMRLRVSFNTALDEVRAEESFRYRVTGGEGDLSVGRATLVSGSTVELTLDEAMQSQRGYTVIVTNLRSEGGMLFSGSGSFLYAPSEVRFEALLSGAQEAPLVNTTASGTGTFVLTATGLSYDITVRNLSGSTITAAHFHRGAPGIAGTVIEPITFTGLRAAGMWTDLTAEERDDLLEGQLYVNVHTPAYPNGEIRGQVMRQ